MAAIYAVYTSPNHAPIPNHLPTLIVTPHGQPSNILYSYLHTNFNSENYLLTPSPQGDLCVAKLYPPKNGASNSSASDPGHGPSHASRVVRCEASRNLKWTIANTGVVSPIYKLSLPSPDSADLPLFQISKPNPNAQFWSMFYFAYAGHLIPPKRIEFGRIQKNPPGPGGGGTRITISGRTPEEKAVWQTLGEGNEDCVEWVVLCAALNLLDDEILKAAEKQHPNPPAAVPAHPNPVPKGTPMNAQLSNRIPPSQTARPQQVLQSATRPQQAPPGNYLGNQHSGGGGPVPRPTNYQRPPPPSQGYQGPPQGQPNTPVPRNYVTSPRPTGGYPQQTPPSASAYPRHI